MLFKSLSEHFSPTRKLWKAFPGWTKHLIWWVGLKQGTSPLKNTWARQGTGGGSLGVFDMVDVQRRHGCCGHRFSQMSHGLDTPDHSSRSTSPRAIQSTFLSQPNLNISPSSRFSRSRTQTCSSFVNTDSFNSRLEVKECHLCTANMECQDLRCWVRCLGNISFWLLDAVGLVIGILTGAEVSLYFIRFEWHDFPDCRISPSGFRDPVGVRWRSGEWGAGESYGVYNIEGYF